MALTGAAANALRVCAPAVLTLELPLTAAPAQTDVVFPSSFTPGEDVRLGRETAGIVTSLLPVLRDGDANRFVGDASCRGYT